MQGTLNYESGRKATHYQEVVFAAPALFMERVKGGSEGKEA